MRRPIRRKHSPPIVLRQEPLPIRRRVVAVKPASEALQPRERVRTQLGRARLGHDVLHDREAVLVQGVAEVAVGAVVEEVGVLERGQDAAGRRDGAGRRRGGRGG